MRYISSKSSNFGIIGSASSVAALALAMCGGLACSAEDPEPFNPGLTNSGATGAPQPTVVAPQPISTVATAQPNVVPTTPPAATAQQPNPMPTTPSPDPATQPMATGGLPMPPGPGAGTPAPVDSSMTPPAATDTAPAETAPDTAAPEPDEDTTDIPSGEGNLLQANAELWINGSSNGVGVQGGWYEYDDGDTEDFAIALVDDAVCISGSMGISEDPATEWGAGLGLVLKDAGDDKQDEWDGSDYSGFSFTADITSATDVTIEMVTSDADPPHEATLKNGANTVTWDDVEQPSWASDTTSFDEATLLKLQFKVARSAEEANDFELCISNLTVE